MSMITILVKIIRIIGKLLLLLLGIMFSIYVLFMLFLFVSDWIWPEFNGSHDLGNNIYMLDGDGNGRIIVYCSNKEGKTCCGGSYLIPTYENGYDSNDNFAEYVVTAKSDERWVIVKTDNHLIQQRKYYIINKDYDPIEMTTQDIIDTKIECFADSSEFANNCLKNGIALQFPDERKRNKRK